MSDHAPHSIEAEENVLGALLLVDTPLPALLVDDGLRPEHFYREQHRAIFRAMVGLHDRGAGVDSTTVWAELERTRAERDVHPSQGDVHRLAGPVPSAGNVRHYARRVIELAQLRAKREAAYELLQGVANEDHDAIAEAEGRLAFAETRRARRFTPEALAERALDRIEGGKVEAFPLPFERLTRAAAGGLKRGNLTILSGHSSHGKSAFLDQALEGLARQTTRGTEGTDEPRRLRVVLYINEMTEDERWDRAVARVSGIPLVRLQQAQLRDGEHGKFIEAQQRLITLGIELVDVAGWAPEDVARDVLRLRPDVWALDILNQAELGRGETQDFDRASRVLNQAAKRTRSHAIVVAHVNEKRVIGAKRPKPTYGDLRSSGALKNDADNVLYVWRDQSDDGDLILDEGRIYFAKARNGITDGLDVMFDGNRQRFAPLLTV